MSVMGAFVLLGIFVLLYSVIIEVFTILFRLTGLTHEKARTQVISMLTNSGFTTGESEIILSARKRRRLAQVTMLFGYSFTVIIVSSIVNVFMSMSNAQMENWMMTLLLVTLVTLVAILVLRVHTVRNWLDHTIEVVGNRMMFGKHSNPVVLIDMYSDNAMAEVFLEHVPQHLQGVPLDHTGLRETMDIHVLYIKRADGEVLKISGQTVLLEGDVLLLFGKYRNIRTVFENTAVLPEQMR